MPDAITPFRRIRARQVGCLSSRYAPQVLPIIYGPLYKNSLGHWNNTVEGLAQNVLKLYMDYDMALFDQQSQKFVKEDELNKDKASMESALWAQLLVD